MAGGELWKEMVRLIGLPLSQLAQETGLFFGRGRPKCYEVCKKVLQRYGELLQEMELKEVPGWIKEQALEHRVQQKEERGCHESTEPKSDNLKTSLPESRSLAVWNAGQVR